jgi:hypothetical protein
MNISATIGVFAAVVFAAICAGFAVTGFMSLGSITDAAQASDARGFAWFWTFLGAVAVVFGAVSFWIARTQAGRDA